LIARDEYCRRDNRRALIALMGAYLAATWWYTIPFGPVWDDWVLLAHGARSLLAVAGEASRGDHALLILPFHASGQPWTWMLAAWMCLGAATGLIFLTARQVRGVTLGEAFWVAALTATAPLYQARFMLSVLPYAFSAVCFAASLFLLSSHLNRPGLGRRIGALAFLLLACTTNSFLTLCWIPLALVAWNSFATGGDRGTIKENVIRVTREVLWHSEFVLVPAIAFLLRRILLPSHGLYANYNQIKLSPIAAVGETLSVLWKQFLGFPVLIPSLSSLPDAVLPAASLVIMGWVIAWYFNPRIGPDTASSHVTPRYLRWMFLALALSTPFFALYPYVIVQQPPRFSGLWETRHQLTLMLVSGSVLVCLLRFFGSIRALHVSATIMIFVFLTLDYGTARQFLVDRLEQREIERKLAANPPPPGSLVLMVESDRGFRMFGRFFAFYELSRIVNRIDGRDDRLVVSNREVIDPETGTYATRANLPVVEKMLQYCTLRGRPEFGFSGFSFHGITIQESMDPQTDRIPLAKAVQLTISGELTDWIKLDRKSVRIETPICGPQ
jgi:hypothetical protein